MKKLSKSLCSLLAIPLAVLPLSASRPVSTLANEPVSVWITTGDQTKLLQPQANVSFSSTAPAAGTAITVNEGSTYQSLDGFGATMTGSSAN